MHIDCDVLLDATLDDCPVPVIKTKEMLDKMDALTVLQVVTSKEGTISNLRTFVKNYPCELVREIKTKERFYFYIKKL
ncbi:MAG: sulfurtransferase TusA family protein [Gallionellaceae bacterium]|nr:sulfurtransferase TusA family protein [Gallionellaceae bacterium]